ncbi:MAG: hypothetical protein BroJett011_42060 [Chloroflexota bacterium]|nr:MAG: hypothetical protein BroJett011_42060 [Chloroflexota bacterium]
MDRYRGMPPQFHALRLAIKPFCGVGTVSPAALQEYKPLHNFGEGTFT